MNTTITLSDIEKELLSKSKDLKERISELTEKIRLNLHNVFLEKNGCTVCRGRGWIVTHDTLDSLSGCFAEYGNCTNPKCTEESRKRSGLDSTYSNYDRNNGIANPVENSFQFKIIVEPLILLLEETNLIAKSIASCRDNGIRTRGTDIIVVRGRKVPIGKIGRIEYVNPSHYGTYLRCTTAEGESFSVSLANVDIVYNPSIHSF